MVEIDYDRLNRELEEAASQRDAGAAHPTSFDAFFPSVYGRIFQRTMDKAYEVKDVDYYFDLDCTGMTLFKRRLIRKVLKFLFHKNFEKQKEFNTLMQETIQMLHAHIKRQEELLDRNMQVIRSLEERIRMLEAKQ